VVEGVRGGSVTGLAVAPNRSSRRQPGAIGPGDFPCEHMAANTPCNNGRMSGAIRISLPEAIAEELIEEGVAAPSVMTRGVGDVVNLVVTVVEAGSSAVTVAVAASAVPRLARRVAAHVRSRNDSGASAVVIRNGPREVVVTVPEGLSIDDVELLLVRVFDEVSADAPAS
jgi:hypothetical protein